MKILADTHTFLWFVTDAPQLSAKAKTLLEAPDTERFFSLASAGQDRDPVELSQVAVLVERCRIRR